MIGRQTEGFLRSLDELLGLGLPIPDDTTISRRLQGLGNLQSMEFAEDDPIHNTMTSPGMPIASVWGEGPSGEGGGRQEPRDMHQRLDRIRDPCASRGWLG